jgi:exosortase
MTSATVVAEPAPSATSPLVRRLLIAGLAAALLVVYGPTIVWLFGRWTLSVWHHAHGLFIPPLVGWLVYEELRRHPARSAQGSPWGFVFLVPALLLHVLDTGIRTQLLSAASIVVALPGIALLLLGWERTKAILFPLLFTGFALPIPLAATEGLHLFLRKVTTAFLVPMISATGVSLYSEGTTIQLPNATVQIADACSGFSTLYASLAFAFLLAYFTRSTKRRILVLLLAAPIAVASNVARMFLLLMTVVWQGPWVLDTFIHPLSGMLTFALALPLLLWIGSDPRPAKGEAAAAPSQRTGA